MTERRPADDGENTILIHTSVKLVTQHAVIEPELDQHFNPHEREARDRRFQKSAAFLPRF